MRDILPVVVDGLWRQGAKNLAVRLVSAEGQPLPAWTPGSHIDLHLPCGLIRQYSLTGSPAEQDRYLLCIARESQSRGGSRYIHDTLRPGQPLMISAPRNHFPLHEGGHVVLLAAGIGITPLLAMAHARAASGASFTLHYYVSRAQEAAFATEIARQLSGESARSTAQTRGRVRASGWRRIWGLRTPTPGSTSAVRPDLWPGFAIPRGRSDGRRRNCTAKRSSRPPRRRRRRRMEPSPSPSPPPGSAGRCRGQNHRPGAAGAWRRGAALLRDGDLRRLPDAGTRGDRRPPGYRAVGGGKTGRRAAYCAVLLPQPVGQFSYRSRGISGPSPAGRRGRPVSPVRRRRQSPSRSTAADRCR